MSNLDELGATETRRKRERGSVNNKNRLEAFRSKKETATTEWSSADAGKVLDVIDRITALGGGVIFGMSRDRGSFLLTLLLGDNKETLYFNGGADLDVELDGVIDTLDSL